MHLSIAACVSFSLHQSRTDSSTSCSNKNRFSVCHPHKLSVGKNRRRGENWNFKYNICQWNAHRDCLLADYTCIARRHQEWVATKSVAEEIKGNCDTCPGSDWDLNTLENAKRGKVCVWTLLCATVSHSRHPPRFMRDMISLYHHSQQKHCKRL